MNIYGIEQGSIPGKSITLLFIATNRRYLGATPPPKMRIGNSFPHQNKSDSSLPSNAEFDNAWSFTFITLFAFMECRLDTGANVPQSQQVEQSFEPVSCIYIIYYIYIYIYYIYTK
jgi:hypothetical protein